MFANKSLNIRIFRTQSLLSHARKHQNSRLVRERTDVAHEVPFFYLCGGMVGEPHKDIKIQ